MADAETLRKLDELIAWEKKNFWSNLPDNQRATYHEGAGDSTLTPGQAKLYYFPEWTRNFYIEDLDSTDTSGTSGYLYVWYDHGEEGTKQLPKQAPYHYETLVTQGDFISEKSKHAFVLVMPDSSATAPEYVVKFTGRKVDDLSE